MATRIAMITITMRSSMIVKAGVSLDDGLPVCLVLSLLLFINIVFYSISLPFLVIRLIYCYLDICYFRFKFHRGTYVLMYLCTYVLMYLLRV